MRDITAAMRTEENLILHYIDVSFASYEWFFSVFDSQNLYHLKVQFKIDVNSEKFTVKWTIKAIAMATKKNSC